MNDTYGHQAGDEILREFSNILLTHARRTDRVGRWGGEEFIIVCPETDRSGLRAFAENLRKTIEQNTFPVVGKKTSSFGGVVYQPGDTMELIVGRADEALYRAKSLGRNKVELADISHEKPAAI